MKPRDLRPPARWATASYFDIPLTLTVKSVGSITVPNFETKKKETWPLLFVGDIPPIRVTDAIREQLIDALGDVELVGQRIHVSRYKNTFGKWSLRVDAVPAEKPAPPPFVVTKESLVAQFDKLAAPKDVPVDKREAWQTEFKQLFGMAKFHATNSGESLELGSSFSASYDLLKEYVDTLRPMQGPEPAPSPLGENSSDLPATPSEERP